jgi:hypothetical protein
VTGPQAPWRPMSEAPKDGTIIVAMYGDMSGVAICSWAEYADHPGKYGWFEFMNGPDDLEEMEESLVDDGSYGWVPFPVDRLTTDGE